MLGIEAFRTILPFMRNGARLRTPVLFSQYARHRHYTTKWAYVTNCLEISEFLLGIDCYRLLL